MDNGERATFETLYARLEEHARRLEQGNLPLEEALEVYAAGAAIAGQLREILERAELRLETIERQLAGDRRELEELEPDWDEDNEDA